MSLSARTGLLEALMRVAAILAITITWTEGCRNYQSLPTLDSSFGSMLTSEAAGFKLILTTDAESNAGCYNFKFKDDETFEMEWTDNYYNPQMRTGYFIFNPRSFSEAATIDLGLPSLTLGAGLFGGSLLYILHVSTDLSYFVTISCGFFNREHVHVFGKATTVAQAPTIKASLVSDEVPHADELREVDQVCSRPAPNLRDLLPSRPASPASPQPTHLVSFQNGVPVHYVAFPLTGNPASPLPNYPISSNNVAPVQKQQYYFQNPARPAAAGFSSSSAFRPPFAFQQNISPGYEYVPSSNVNNPSSVVKQYVTAGSLY